LFGEDARSKGLVATDIDPSQKDHECHDCPCAREVRALMTQGTKRNVRISNI
jgi:hypothetical protein